MPAVGLQTVVCPAKNGDVHHIRIPGIPEVAHEEIYRALGVDWKNLPRHHIIKKAGFSHSDVVSLR